MYWYQWISLAALVYCSLLLSSRFTGLLKRGAPKDLSEKSGNVGKAVLYSYTAAMSPANKESAYLHLPTFTAGLFFHAGTFLSILLFLWFILNSFLSIEIPPLLSQILSAVLFITAASGLSIFIKRAVKKELREMSGFDDYFSNGITTLVQFFTALYLLFPGAAAMYYIATALFFLWLPSGKTKHLLYFFLARYHLGFFYGWRGTWPPKPA